MKHSEILREARKMVEEDKDVSKIYHRASISTAIAVLSYLIEQYESTGR